MILTLLSELLPLHRFGKLLKRAVYTYTAEVRSLLAV